MVSGEKDVASVAATHVTALDAQIRSLKVPRAVLSTVARRGSTAQEEVAEFNAAGRGPRTPAGASMWFARKLVQRAAEARQQGVAPESPEAERILRDLLGDADPVASAHRAEFAWVVAALEARAGS